MSVCPIQGRNPSEARRKYEKSSHTLHSAALVHVLLRDDRSRIVRHPLQRTPFIEVKPIYITYQLEFCLPREAETDRTTRDCVLAVTLRCHCGGRSWRCRGRGREPGRCRIFWCGRRVRAGPGQ